MHFGAACSRFRTKNHAQPLDAGGIGKTCEDVYAEEVGVRCSLPPTWSIEAVATLHKTGFVNPKILPNLEGRPTSQSLSGEWRKPPRERRSTR